MEHEEVAPPRSKVQPVTLSTFEPREKNVVQNDESCLQLTLQENESAAFIGEYEVSVTNGIVTVYGAVLRPNSGPQRVYAPSILALPQIQARQPNTTIRLSSLRSGLRKLAKLSPLFRNIWNADGESKRSFQFLQSSEDDDLRRSLYTLKIDRDMDLVLRTLSAKSVSERQQPRIMTIGGKSTGKSTFNRILCNHLNSWTPKKKCFYLDLDPGQPEFGPPGQVSLVEVSAPILGPSFTHPASSQSTSFRLLRSHTIAATTFKDDPNHYKECAKDLIRHANRTYPLVINACGWTSGLGGSVILDLFMDLSITDAVLMEPLDVDLDQSLQSATQDATLHRIPRRPPKPSSRSPAENRAMQTMAYFHTRHIDDSDSLKINGKAIDHMRHWNVSYADHTAGTAAVVSYNQSPNPEFLAETIDGSLVALVVMEQYAAKGNSKEATEMIRDVSEHISRTPEGIPYVEADDMGVNRTLDPRSSRCIGLALVCGIDIAGQSLQLVTPLSERPITEIAGQTVVLVKGNFDAPGWAYLEDIYKNQYDGKSETDDIERPWVSRTGQVGIEGSVWRLRHPPLATSQPMRT